MSENNEWIKEKKSWMIHTTPSGNGNFAPRDPICGRWTAGELLRVFGTTDLTILRLKGKWEGEVVIYKNKPLKDAFENRLAEHLIHESTGERLDLYGDVLMTLAELVDEIKA